MIKNSQPTTTKVLVTGVFDLLHAEHGNFLRKAATLGDILLIGVESDKRVKEIKGVLRPILPQEVRVANLQKLMPKAEVFVLPEAFSAPADHLALLQKLQPQVLAVSSHTAHLAAKEALMAQVGGKVVIVHDHNPEISTSILIGSKT